ncbi:hypothetical protein [Saccharothrix deserti]|uniref:hypothetical protein n=1 Tax=Saccharothrix deserti TaxID=2593674 RepID=UPI00131E240A|nr:hypothetical protein [Saccharothrix deserti]
MPVPTPSGHIFDSTSTFTTGKANSPGDADAHREQMAKGADVAAQEATAWTTFGNELAELVGKLQSVLGDLGGLTNLPTVELEYFGMGTEVPRHGVNGKEMIGHLTALMRDSRAIGAAYEAACLRLAAAVTDHAE